MYMKARFGMHDAWAQLTYDLDAIDWQAKRAHREDFVFDSGCLECHQDLERASEQSAKSFVAHKPYFLGTVEARCVTCHENVGHKNLSTHLAAAGKKGSSQ
jgi:cytochrome c-type protein NapC